MDGAACLYLCFMLGVFPLLYKYQYAGMGDYKYSVFTRAAEIFIFVILLFAGVYLLKENTRTKITFTILDKAVLCYFAFTSVSFAISPFRQELFAGSDGWNMGYLSQLLFVCIYFCVSRCFKWKTWLLGLFMLSSGIVFGVGFLHRFDVDILNIYGDLELEHKVQFLSTMGQSSWYSSFLCVAFPIGLYLFFAAEKRSWRVAGGIYTFIAMCSLVTQNTDSAFLSLFAVVFVLFYLSFDEKKERVRLLETGMLISGSFTFVGVVQRIFADRMIPLDKLSLFVSQSGVMPVLFIVFSLLFFFYGKMGKEGEISRKWFAAVSGCFLAGVAGTIVFIVFNSTGFLNTHFGYQNVDNYLLFSDQWGNGRGFAWRYSIDLFRELSFLQKWIGVGPDGYSFFAGSVPALSDKMVNFWGNLVLTNSHNEYLTKLINGGILGLSAYVCMLGSAVYLFIRERKKHEFLPAFALCTAAYAVHNIFCYEQVCCSPFFYILLGMGESLLKNYKKAW